MKLEWTQNIELSSAQVQKIVMNHVLEVLGEKESFGKNFKSIEIETKLGSREVGQFTNERTEHYFDGMIVTMNGKEK